MRHACTCNVSSFQSEMCKVYTSHACVRKSGMNVAKRNEIPIKDLRSESGGVLYSSEREIGAIAEILLIDESGTER